MSSRIPRAYSGPFTAIGESREGVGDQAASRHRVLPAKKHTGKSSRIRTSQDTAAPKANIKRGTLELSNLEHSALLL